MVSEGDRRILTMSLVGHYYYGNISAISILRKINALKFAQGRFQSTIETNTFIVILILGFNFNKWKLKPN